MSDNSYNTNFGPSTPGALNLVSGQTNGVTQNLNGTGAIIGDGNGGYSVISDADPLGDVCSTSTGEVFQMGGQNIGDLLNSAGVSWGFFEGGFDLTITNSERNHGLQSLHHLAGHGCQQEGLHSAPSAVPVLRFHRQPAAHASDLGR